MKNINLRLDDDLHAQLKAAAEQDNRSLQQQITWLLKRTRITQGTRTALRAEPCTLTHSKKENQ